MRQAPALKPLPLPGRTWWTGTHLWIAGLGLVGLALVGLIARDTVLSKPAAVALRLTTATRGTVTSVVSGTGSLAPAGRMNVNFRVGGQLSEVDVKIGDKVTTGQILARIDPSAQQAALSQAQASLAAAQANLQAIQSPLTGAQIAQLQHQLSNAQQNYNDTVTSVNLQNNTDAATVAADCPASPACIADRTKQSSDRVSGQIRINQAAQQITSSRDNLNVQEQVKPNAIASAQAQVASAAAQVQAAQLTVAQTSLASPTSGVVTSINGVSGEFVGAGGGTTAQSPGSVAPAPGATGSSTSSAFMVIDDTSSFLAVMPFAETDAARLQANQTASLTFDAVTGLTISGHLLSISPSATIVSNVVDYYATFVLNRTDPRLRTGMTANASVVVAQADNAIRVSNAAVHTTAGTTMVTVYANGEQVPTEVVVGVVGDTTTEIKAGLNEGDRVVLPALRTGTGTTTTGAGGLLRGGGLGGGGVRGGGG